MNAELSFTGTLWAYGGDSSWYFITLPKDLSDDIKLMSSDLLRRGFGSVRVEVKVGDSTWQTSVFPDKKSGCYLLPIKKEVRQKNDLTDGSTTSVTLIIARL